jgi:hypothetical protein
MTRDELERERQASLARQRQRRDRDDELRMIQKRRPSRSKYREFVVGARTARDADE